MLFDPKWETKNDRVFQGVSLRGLIAFLETKPADEHYNYFEGRECAIAQYRQAMGVAKEASYVELFGVEPGDEGWWLEEIVNPVEGDWTFGAALERARTHLP